MEYPISSCIELLTDSSSLSHHPPVGNLPAELLIETFAFCASEDSLAPLILATVCQTWRKVITASPRVWQSVLLDDSRPIKSCHTHALLWITRSAPLPFDVKIHVESADSILPLLSPFLSVFHRWRQLTITGEREESLSLSDSVSRLDSLDDLAVSICDDEHEEDAAVMNRSTFIPFSPLWPNRIAMNVWLSRLPEANSITPLRFTSVSITEQCLSLHIDPVAILNFLEVCPQLQNFCLAGWIHGDLYGTEPLPVVHLPHLHTLQLRSTCLARAILSSIDVPNLEKLYLAHLNVDFRLPGDFHDVGDSEDEAHDFSQSPWSDHATGMGLRNLITRCNPPIKTLEMDFSDMRTKDFIYLFDRLIHLEDFLIVASDMSNTVIKLLRPYNEAALAIATSADVDAEEEDPCLSPSPTLTVRLPRLRNLELYNCHRISGEVVVDTFISRVKYTDRFTPKDSMEELVISDCEHFTHQHGQILMKEMGPRVRLG